MKHMEKTVLITGASGGIGAEFAKIYFNEGYKLILTARNKEKLDNLKASISSNQDLIKTISMDLSLPDSPNELFKLCKNDNVNILVNNAGFGLFGENTTLAQEQMEKMIQLNITSLVILCQLFGEQMKQKESGGILNISSLAAYQPVPKLAAYAASKSFVLNFSESISRELNSYGVTVSCLSPGHTATDFFSSAGIGNRTHGFFSVKTRMNPNKVARDGFNILRKKKISYVSGIKNKLLTMAGRFTPRIVLANISKKWLSNP